MSNLGHFCILPNPAHKPNLFAGFHGLSPSFPPMLVCIVYLQLLEDTPTTKVTLQLKSTLTLGRGCSPAGPLKRRVYQRQWTLWTDGNLVTEEYMDQNHFNVRYVSPTAVYTPRQELDQVLRDHLERTSSLPRHAAVSSTVTEFPAGKPSLFPKREYPAPTPVLQRGLHLFYLELPLPDSLPGSLSLPHLALAHTLTCKLHTQSPPFPMNLVRSHWVHRTDAPLRLPRYNALDTYLAPDQPVGARNAPGQSLGFDVSIPSRVAVAGTMVPITLRLVPDPAGDIEGRLPFVDAIDRLAVAAGDATVVRNAPALPKLTITLRQTVIVRVHKSGASDGSDGNLREKRLVSSLVRLTEAHVSTVQGDLWKRRVNLLVPHTSAAMARLHDLGTVPAKEANVLYPSCELTVVVPKKTRRRFSTTASSRRGKTKKEESNAAAPAAEGPLDGWNGGTLNASAGGATTVDRTSRWSMFTDATGASSDWDGSYYTEDDMDRESEWDGGATTADELEHPASNRSSWRKSSPPDSPRSSTAGVVAGGSSFSSRFIHDDQQPGQPNSSAAGKSLRKALSALNLHAAAAYNNSGSPNHTGNRPSSPLNPSSPRALAGHQRPMSYSGMSSMMSATASTSSLARADSIGTNSRIQTPMSTSVADLHAPAAVAAAAAMPPTPGRAPDGSGDPAPGYPVRPPIPPAPAMEQEGAPLLSPRRPPSYREIDLPSPMTLRLDSRRDMTPTPDRVDQKSHSGKRRVAVVDIVVRHELVVEAQVGKDEVEVAIPLLVNEGDDTCREEILRHVCA